MRLPAENVTVWIAFAARLAAVRGPPLAMVFAPVASAKPATPGLPLPPPLSLLQ
jgi:hypothetical protein